MKKLILLMLLFPFCLSAQDNMYEGFEKIPEGMEFKKFSDVTYKKGIQEGYKGKGKYKFDLLRHSNGLPMEFQMHKYDENAKEWKFSSSAREDFKEEGAVGYPHTRYMTNGITRLYDVFMVIDGKVFEVTMSDDQTQVEKIAVYIPTTESTKLSGKNTDGSKKKLTMKEKLLIAKQKTNSIGYQDPKYPVMMSGNYVKMVNDYITEMKSKSDSYTLTAKDKKDIAYFKASIGKHRANIKAYNDSIFATPEYQAALAKRRRMEGKTSSSSSGERCTIVNDLSSAQVNSSGNIKLAFQNYSSSTANLARGHSMEVRCDGVVVYKGKPGTTAYGAKLFSTKGKCGQTIKLSSFW